MSTDSHKVEDQATIMVGCSYRDASVSDVLFRHVSKGDGKPAGDAGPRR